jgi:hypothetical protein
MSCTSNFHTLFPKISVRGSFSSSLKGEKTLFKREHSLRGSNPFEDKLLFTSYMLLMSSFSVVDAKGGEV